VPIGVIRDPHGCLVKLRATLDRLVREVVDQAVCATNVVTFGPKRNAGVSMLSIAIHPSVGSGH